MNNTGKQRIDEVSKHYSSIEQLEKISTILFWTNSFLSCLVLYLAPFISKSQITILQSFFLVLVLIYFCISQLSSLYLVPKAELMRRKQLLSNSFGVPLSTEHTSLYYNNSLSPSVERLGANTMENAFFSQSVASKMLDRKRVIIGVYIILWLFAILFRFDNLELLTVTTQLIFSSEIISGWLKLEILRSRFERIYEDLHCHFLDKLGKKSPIENVIILNAFASYESAKSTAGILLSTQEFQALNSTLSKQWEQIRQELDIK